MWIFSHLTYPLLVSFDGYNMHEMEDLADETENNVTDMNSEDKADMPNSEEFPNVARYYFASPRRIIFCTTGDEGRGVNLGGQHFEFGGAMTVAIGVK